MDVLMVPVTCTFRVVKGGWRAKKKKKQDIKWILILVITVNNFTLLLMKTNVALANEEKLNCLAKVWGIFMDLNYPHAAYHLMPQTLQSLQLFGISYNFLKLPHRPGFSHKRWLWALQIALISFLGLIGCNLFLFFFFFFSKNASFKSRSHLPADST